MSFAAYMFVLGTLSTLYFAVRYPKQIKAEAAKVFVNCELSTVSGRLEASGIVLVLMIALAFLVATAGPIALGAVGDIVLSSRLAKKCRMRTNTQT